MSKVNRSSSQLLHKRHTSEHQNNQHVPKQMEERLIKKTAQLFSKNSSRILFPNANTPNKNENEKPQLTRNKSLSSSKSKLFEKAHQVNKNETFQRPFFAQASNSSAFSASNTQYNHYKNINSQAKFNEIAERKLIISKVIANTDQSKSKLTLRDELLKSQMEKQKSKRLEQKRYHQQYQNSIQYEHPKDLTQSKQFDSQRANQAKYNRSKALQSNDSFNLSTSNFINEDRLKTYSKQLESSIKESIKREMEEHFIVKEKELEQKYLQKEKLYLQKFKQLQSVMESQLQRQRSILLTSINDQLEKQLQKKQIIEQPKYLKSAQISRKQEYIEPTIRKGNEIKAKSTITQQPKQLIDLKQEDQKIQVKIVKQTPNKLSQPNINPPQRKASINIPKQTTKISQINQIDELDQLNEAKPVQKVKSPPSQTGSNQPKNNNKANQAKPNRLLGQDKGKKSNSIYNAQDSYLDQIQEVKLNLESKMSPQKPNNHLKDKYQRVNQSFNAEKKLNQSFTSEKPAPLNKPLKPQKAPPAKKQTEQEKLIAKLQERKTLVRNKLKQQIKNDENVIAIGQVAGYCSKYCKNSKVDWRIPSLLLYRYCFDFFRSFRALYLQALQLNLIKKEQLDKYNSYDEVMEQNLAKMYKSITKKVTLSNVYKQIIESEQLQLQRLKPYALLQAKNYVKELSKSKESKPKQGDPLVIQCGLRVINSIYIIKKLNGLNVELINTDIQSLSEQDLYQLFDQWSRKLLSEE